MSDIAYALTDVMQGFSKLVESAPDAPSPTESIQRAPEPSYVKTAHGWGERYTREIALTGPEWFAAYETAKPIVATGGILAFIGPRGPGKTRMAAELARTGKWPAGRVETSKTDGGIIKHGKIALYRRAMDIFLDLRHAAKNHVKSSEKEVLAQLAEVGLLVIDEFQERGETEWENRIVKNLIDKRYASGYSTIIIANLTRQELFSALGDSVIDRARENGKSIEFSWASFRSGQANQARVDP